MTILGRNETMDKRTSVIPEDKMRRYLNYCKDKKVNVLCDCCNKAVEVSITPYFYDKQENDVYFASLCPECGDLLVIKE